MADIKQIKIGEVPYNIKDAVARGAVVIGTISSYATPPENAQILVDYTNGILYASNGNSWERVADRTTVSTSVSSGNSNAVSSGAVYSHVNTQITNAKAYAQELVNAVKQFTYEVVTQLGTASASTMNKIYLVAKTNGTNNAYDEYITIQSGTTYSWEKIGSTDIAISNYVPKTTTIAGVDLKDNITATELKTSLGLENVDNTPDLQKTVNKAYTAENATKDAENNTFTTTYISEISVDGKTIKYRRPGQETSATAAINASLVTASVSDDILTITIT